MNDTFRRIAQAVSQAAGRPLFFVLALLVVITWALTGPVFGFSDTWQLVINTSTTIVTFLMVFLIQNTQNRDTKAINLKLDELLKSVHGARTSLVALETMSDEDLTTLEEEFDRLHQYYAHLSEQHRKLLHSRKKKRGQS